MRQRYVQPGSFTQWQEQPANFERYRLRSYFGLEFVQESRGGQLVLLLRPS